jgi:hypothetical protein
MPDEFDTQVVAALRTLERDPAGDGRAAVTRRVRRRRVRSVAGAAAAALVVGIGIGAVVASNDDTSGKIVVRQTGPSGPAAPPLPAAATGVLTWPTTVAPGDDFSAVLRNPLSGPNTSCFVVVRLERWDGESWGAPRELLPEGVDPNLAGPGADCAPDLIQPGAFIGERKFTVPADLPAGNYRIVEQSTEGEGRITVIGPDQVAASEPRPASRHSVDLAPGGGLGPEPALHPTLEDARLLDDSRLAISWHSYCNSPGLRFDFDYQPDHVTAHLVPGGFAVIDCVGEPDLWSTVVDLPAPLWGRPLEVATGYGKQVADRVEVTPLSTFVLPLIEPGNTLPPSLSTSIFRQEERPDSVRVQAYGGACITDAQSAVYADDDNVIYVQPHVQVSGHAARCGAWQSLDIPVHAPPDSTFFGPSGFG